MAALKKIGSIEINQDLDFQRQSWKVQRVAWVLMLLVALGGLTGLFGRGPLASAELGEKASPLHVEYERFLRLYAPAKLTVYIGSSAIRADSTVKFWIDRGWLAGMEVRQITPEPETTHFGANEVIYTFRLVPSSRPVRITYELQTRSFGRVPGRVGLIDGPAYAFSHFVYP